MGGKPIPTNYEWGRESILIYVKPLIHEATSIAINTVPEQMVLRTHSLRVGGGS